MFTWLDLIAPIGVAVVAAVLCVWGAIKAKTTPARWISVATGVVFLASIPTWYLVRSSGLKPDYTTTHGIEVKQGEVNKCPREKIEPWTQKLIDFWSGHYDTTKVRDAVKGKLLVCIDEEKMTVWGRLVAGYTHGKFSVIGTRNTMSLFMHEMSHQIVMPFVPYSEEGHHALFKEKGLGH